MHEGQYRGLVDGNDIGAWNHDRDIESDQLSQVPTWTCDLID